MFYGFMKMLFDTMPLGERWCLATNRTILVIQPVDKQVILLKELFLEDNNGEVDMVQF